MQNHTFKLSDSGKEFPARFGGIEVSYTYPENLREVIETLIPEDKREGATALLEALDETSDDVQQMLYGKIMGQGVHLDIQKDGKDMLGEKDDDGNYIHGEGRDGALSLDEVPGRFQKQASEYRLPMPGVKRGEGKAAKAAKAEKRAAVAEAKADALKVGIAKQYKLLPQNARGAFAADLVANGLFTQEEIDELNAA